MTEQMLKMYVRNQIIMNPTYMGETITIQGEKVRTHEIAKKYQEKSKFKRGNGLLELYICAIRNCEEVSMTSKGKQIPMSEVFAMFRETLPQKTQLDLLMDTFMPYISDYVKSHTCTGEGILVDTNLLVPRFDEDTCNQALKHIFGATDSRFIYNLANKRTNGNTLDLQEDIIERFFEVKDPVLSYASLIRALSYPYSDYKQYVSKGMLVSIDLEGLVYVIYDDIIYCISATNFGDVLSSGIEAMPECTKVFNTRDLVLLTKASLGGLR